VAQGAGERQSSDARADDQDPRPHDLPPSRARSRARSGGASSASVPLSMARQEGLQKAMSPGIAIGGRPSTNLTATWVEPSASVSGSRIDVLSGDQI